VIVASEKRGKCRIRNPFDNKRAVLLGTSTGRERTLEGEVLEFETESGSTYFLYPEGKRPRIEDLQIQVPMRESYEINWFGVKSRRKW